MVSTAYLATVRHTRTSPVRHDFTYRTCTWAVSLDDDPNAGLRWWQRPFVRFRAADHLGDGDDWRANLVAFGRERGLDLSACSITALSGAATLGYAFDPLTLYWCTAPDGSLVTVIAEVRNTYGQRHAYVVSPDDRDVARTEKRLYVSPFNDTTGDYTMSVPPPGPQGFDVRITLHRPGQRPFVATWQGVLPHTLAGRLRLLAHQPFASQLVTARIRLQGIRLWTKRLPVQPRPDHLQEVS
ncbi:DUF1365 domain-containing protein [Flexivirga sp. ID2601S]|uniref:DUF1365 domain-containing protein n=1 Tax=Flexivirga aerilata TaxID=1656889 RepID=A0A849AF51_9MICO|nr:DUF1365 domain-containing protein [Flexivirga aerilata]